MKLIYIDDKHVVKPFFKRPFNPPLFGPDFTEEDFNSEYWRVHLAIRVELEEAGRYSDIGIGDFAMNESRADSRWISVDFTTNKMWNILLLRRIALVLSAEKMDYMVYLSHELPEYPLFHILASRDSVMGWTELSEDRFILQCFGFDRKSDNP